MPLLVAALIFIAGSLIAGVFEPRIDLAAHLGGLATGLVCGLLLWRRLPAVPGRRGIVRRLAAAGALCLALAVTARAVTHAVAREPEALAIIKGRHAASYDRLALSIQELIGIHASMRRQVEHVVASLPYQRDPFGNDRVVEHAAENVQAFRGLSAEDDGQRAVLAAVVEAAEEIGAAAGMIKDALDAEDARLPKAHPSRWSKADHEWLRKLWDDAEGPLRAKLEAGKLAMGKALALRDRYLKDHGLDDGLAHVEEVRRRFQEEEARFREMYRLGPSETPSRDDLTGRQFRERMAELEAMMLNAAWSWRSSPGEVNGDRNSAIASPRHCAEDKGRPRVPGVNAGKASRASPGIRGRFPRAQASPTCRGSERSDAPAARWSRRTAPGPRSRGGRPCSGRGSSSAWSRA